MSCNGDKALGPHGFNMRFLHEFWDILKNDSVVVFGEFFYFGSFVKSLHSTFIILIAKTEGYEKTSSY